MRRRRLTRVQGGRLTFASVGGAAHRSITLCTASRVRTPLCELGVACSWPTSPARTCRARAGGQTRHASFLSATPAANRVYGSRAASVEIKRGIALAVAAREAAAASTSASPAWGEQCRGKLRDRHTAVTPESRAGRTLARKQRGGQHGVWSVEHGGAGLREGERESELVYVSRRGLKRQHGLPAA